MREKIFKVLFMILCPNMNSPRMCQLSKDLFGLFQQILSIHNPLLPIQIGSDPLLTLFTLTQLGHRIQQPQKCTITIETGHIEQQLSGLKGKEKRANRSHLLQPSGQIGGHDDDRVLQLAIDLGRQFGVDEF